MQIISNLYESVENIFCHFVLVKTAPTKQNYGRILKKKKQEKDFLSTLSSMPMNFMGMVDGMKWATKWHALKKMAKQ